MALEAVLGIYTKCGSDGLMSKSSRRVLRTRNLSPIRIAIIATRKGIFHMNY